MSWRFRKTFKVLPGVKLNLTRHGLSATLGAAPFSVNVGPRGVYRNVSIPGTGLWSRERLDAPSSYSSDDQSPLLDRGGSPLPVYLPSSPGTEIHSASTESLSSHTMEELRNLLKDAYDERDTLAKEISSAALEANTTNDRYQKWDRGFLMKRIRSASFAARKEAADTAVAKLAELQEQLRLTTLATEITVDREQAEPYYRMRDEFAVLSGCQKIWNVLTEKAIDRIAERSTANKVITRNPVSFSLDSCDLIQWEQQRVPHLQNHTGGDMYIYPGFILYRASKQAFALIDFHVVTLNYVSTHFTEAEKIPSDTQVVGQTWAKSNKDGTPDRRFQGNYQIPVVHYGSLLFTSPDGLDVRYLCSNAAFAERFAKGWAAFRASFSFEVRSDGSDATKQARASEDFQAASERFTTINHEFMNRLQTPTGKGTMSKEDFMTYMASVVEFITAAKGSREIPDPLQFHAARANLQHSIQTFEAARTYFEKSVCERGMNTEMFLAYVNALTSFYNAITQFANAVTRGVTKGRKPGAKA